MHGRLPAFLVGLLVLASVRSASALTFDNTFDSTVTSNANAAGFESAFEYAESQLSASFSDPITINLTLTLAPGTSTLGESSTTLYSGLNYSNVRYALTADATTTNDLTSVSSLGVTDPTGGGDFLVSSAEAKALGYTIPSNVMDGTVTFGAGWTYTFDPNNRAVSGKFDLIGIAEHEITEVMGRIAVDGQDLGTGNPDFVPYDLFRYSGAGTRSLSDAATNAYFSINSGVTNLKSYNPAGNGGDTGDWLSTTNDSFNAFSSPGVMNPMTTADLVAMDVIGYDLVTAPEPSTWAMLAAGALLVLPMGRRLARPV